jgi:hypothetical protein
MCSNRSITTRNEARGKDKTRFPSIVMDMRNKGIMKARLLPYKIKEMLMQSRQ